MKTSTLLAAALTLATTNIANAGQVTEFMATINGDQQVPGPVTTDAVGTLTGVYDSNLNTFSFEWLITGQLTGMPSAPGAHLHNAAAGSNGPIVFGFNDPDGTWDLAGAAIWTGLSSDEVDALFAGEIYANFHTTDFPGGEIRGQLLSIPSPSGVALLAFAGVGGVFKRRR